MRADGRSGGGGSGCCTRGRHSRRLALAVAAASALVWAASGHPQCLDSRPPFRAEADLPFCSAHAKFGCCTVEDAEHVVETYRRVAERASSGVCRKMLADVVCLQCSPYAAHLYGLEARGTVARFPGLCRPYCGELYRRCGLGGGGNWVALLLANDTALLDAAALGEEAFCSAIAIPDVDYCYPDLTRNDVLMRRASPPALSATVGGGAGGGDGCLCVQRVARRLRSPVFVLNANDGSNRLFVGEQLGVVRVMSADRASPGAAATAATAAAGVAVPGAGLRLFLDIRERVAVSSSPGDERGLLGMAFHPRFSQNGRFFVYYFSAPARSAGVVRISEMRVSRRNRDRANDKNETVLLEIRQPHWNHNGGQLLFGEDGYLYAFVGDGGGAGDPDHYAQDLSKLLGKVLRIDVDQPAQAYAIPPDNPFVGVLHARPEVFAYGLRNPWRCSVDRGSRRSGAGRGRIFCGDVGQHSYEEVDLIVPGGNYGWNAREGSRCYDSESCGRIGDEELPIYSYNHTVGKSVTGGYVYRGCESPSLDGLYIFGDYVSGRLFTLRENDNRSDGAATWTAAWTAAERRMCGSDMCFGNLGSDYPTGITSFGEDENGEVYVACTAGDGAMAYSGEIYKLVDPFVRGDPTTCKLASAAARVVNPHGRGGGDAARQDIASATPAVKHGAADGASAELAGLAVESGETPVRSVGELEVSATDSAEPASFGSAAVSDRRPAETAPRPPPPQPPDDGARRTLPDVNPPARSAGGVDERGGERGDNPAAGGDSAVGPQSAAARTGGDREAGADSATAGVQKGQSDGTTPSSLDAQGQATSAAVGDDDVAIAFVASDVVRICFKKHSDRCYQLTYDGSQWHIA